VAEGVVGRPAKVVKGELVQLLEELRQATRRDYDRDLSLEELIGDRWERARSLGWGNGSSIYASSLVYGRVVVGEGTWVGPFTLLDGSGNGIEIGRGCDISAGVHIYTHDTARRAVSGGSAANLQERVRVGDFVHVGANAVILPGVTIGDRVVVGAGAVVTRSVDTLTIVAGVPARRIGQIVLRPDGSVHFDYSSKDRT
jgi:carbonic anhydrase/acetyltransferase-like protein (isoleucine patch superfamily)